MRTMTNAEKFVHDLKARLLLCSTGCLPHTLNKQTPVGPKCIG